MPTIGISSGTDDLLDEVVDAEDNAITEKKGLADSAIRNYVENHVQGVTAPEGGE